jgi:hypothetical protein
MGRRIRRLARLWPLTTAAIRRPLGGFGETIGETVHNEPSRSALPSVYERTHKDDTANAQPHPARVEVVKRRFEKGWVNDGPKRR